MSQNNQQFGSLEDIMTFVDFGKHMKKLSKIAPDAKVYVGKDYYEIQRVSGLHAYRGYYDELALADTNVFSDAKTVKEISDYVTALEKNKKFLHKKGGEYTPEPYSSVWFADEDATTELSVGRIDFQENANRIVLITVENPW